MEKLQHCIMVTLELGSSLIFTLALVNEYFLEVNGFYRKTKDGETVLDEIEQNLVFHFKSVCL